MDMLDVFPFRAGINENVINVDRNTMIYEVFQDFVNDGLEYGR